MTPLTTLAQALKDDARVAEICKAVWLVQGEAGEDPCIVLNCQETPVSTVSTLPDFTGTLLVYCYSRTYEGAYDLRTRVIDALQGRSFTGIVSLDAINFTGQQAALVPTTGQSALCGIPLTFECLIRRA